MKLLVMACLILSGLVAAPFVVPVEDAAPGDEPPARVAAALERYSRGMPLEEVHRVEHDGFVVWVAEWTARGLEFEIALGEEGELIELEHELPADKVPAPVRAAARAELGEVAMEFEKLQTVTYEVEATVDGVGRELLISPDGEIIESSVDDDDDGRDDDDDDDDDEEGDDDEMDLSIADLPAAVRAAAESAVPGIVLSGAALEEEGGTTLYEIHGTAGGVDWCIEVGTDGRLIEVEEDD